MEPPSQSQRWNMTYGRSCDSSAKTLARRNRLQPHSGWGLKVCVGWGWMSAVSCCQIQLVGWGKRKWRSSVVQIYLYFILWQPFIYSCAGLWGWGCSAGAGATNSGHSSQQDSQGTSRIPFHLSLEALCVTNVSSFWVKHSEIAYTHIYICSRRVQSMVWHNQAIPLPAQQANCLIGMANLGILNRY